MSKSALKAPFVAVAHPTPQTASALDKYLSKGSAASQTARSFVETMREWQTILKNVHVLADKLSDDVFNNLGMFTACVTYALPDFCTMCEVVSRHNRNAYTEFCELIGLGVRIHAYGIARRHGDHIEFHRYGRALNVITELLKCPEPRNGDVRLPPLYVDEGTQLARTLSNSMSDICLIIFKQMRADQRNDQVDFLLERTTHILAEGTRYTEDARRGMRAAFETVYKQMTPQEKHNISNSRFYTRCEAARHLIFKMIHDIGIAELKDECAFKMS